MEIRYYGANCVKLSDKKIILVVDDNLSKMGLKPVAKPQDVAVYTAHIVLPETNQFLINGPGEYEISEVSIRGIAAQAHTDENGLNATLYSIKIDDFNIGIIGHINANLSDDQLEAMGVVDVLIIPIGGHGYTLDADEAVSIIKKIEPKIVIPTHYADEAIKYEVPQADLQLFLKAVGISEPEVLEVLTVKEKELGDKTRTVILKRLEIK
jgi:hypothetical protein